MHVIRSRMEFNTNSYAERYDRLKDFLLFVLPCSYCYLAVAIVVAPSEMDSY